MKKTILIDIGCIIPTLAEVSIHPYAITSIVRIARDLGYQLSLQPDGGGYTMMQEILLLILASEGVSIAPPGTKPDIQVSDRQRPDTTADSLIVFDALHNDWRAISDTLRNQSRLITHERNTKETQISISLNLDGTGQSSISTGLHFFDHMLEQIARHGGIDLSITAHGDLHIDEHHTIEDTGIALGEAFALALGDKRGIERYGFCLPMDDTLAQVAIDFGGRNWIVWEAAFKREKVGDMPTEMFFHFFKSFSDSARCNLNIIATGDNEHHKIEAIFKAFAKAIKMATRRDLDNMQLPTTKGLL